MDLTRVQPDFRKEIVRGADVYLDGQLRIATSADQRAAVLAGIFVAAATGLIAALVAMLTATGQAPAKPPVAMMIGGGLTAAMFLFAAVESIRSIMPVGFYIPGCSPEIWADDVMAGKSLDDCLGERAKHLQENINDNLKVIERNARLFQRAAIVGIAAPFAGLVAWILTSVCKFGG